MRRMLTAGFGFATLVTLTSCGGGRDVPTRPSTPSSAAVASPGESTPTIVPWSCLVQNVSAAGIFASGIVDAGCSKRLTIQSRAFAGAAPGPPPNLTASVNGTTVTLSWVVPTSPDPASSYVIEAGSSPGSTNIIVFDTLSTNTSFTATGVPAGTYYARVRARNSAGTSSASNEVVILVGGGCASPPGAPTALAATVSGSTVTLTWTAPAGGCAPSGYMIEAGATSGSSSLANFNTGSTATTFSAAGVSVGTYYVRVRSASSNGVSGSSNEIVVTVGGAVNVTGRWIDFDLTGARSGDQIILNLTQTGAQVTGTMSVVKNGLTKATYNLSGSVSGNTFSFSTDSSPCGGPMTWSVQVAGTTMQGGGMCGTIPFQLLATKQ